MASRRATAPGFEPAKGFPDPALANTNPKIGPVTHYPTLYGPVCAQKPTPTDAGAYDPTDPTCEKCARWLNAARQVTAAQMPWTKPPPAEDK
jgi:hypothetical protein